MMMTMIAVVAASFFSYPVLYLQVNSANTVMVLALCHASVPMFTFMTCYLLSSQNASLSGM